MGVLNKNGYSQLPIGKLKDMLGFRSKVSFGKIE